MKEKILVPMSAGETSVELPTEIDWGGWLADAVSETTPKSPKGWKTKLFKFGRIVASAVGTNRNAEELRPGVLAWVESARRARGLESLTVEDVLDQLIEGMAKIRCPIGQPGRWDAVETRAKTLEPPAFVTENFPKDRSAWRLASLCMSAGLEFDDRPFGLDCRRVGRFIDCGKSKASGLIHKFEKSGWLVRVSTGKFRNRCNTYRWKTLIEPCCP